VHAQDEKDFRIFFPLEAIEKGDDPQSRRIQGFATTEHKDREGETVLQRGLDFSEFLSFGYFNDNHDQSTKAALGWPLSVEQRTTPDGRLGHYVEGYLIRGYEPADKIWELATSLQKNNAPRRVGFSVEGKILQRQGEDGKTVSKAKVRHVAITLQPVNPYCGMEALQKALTDGSAVAAPAVAPGEGFPLRVEGVPPKKKRKKRMSPDEAKESLLEKGYSSTEADRIVSLAMATH
jgi:hypothetical protein